MRRKIDQKQRKVIIGTGIVILLWFLVFLHESSTCVVKYGCTIIGGEYLQTPFSVVLLRFLIGTMIISTIGGGIFIFGEEKKPKRRESK